ncbi:DUF6862 domain-containing protein [Gemmata palustris]
MFRLFRRRRLSGWRQRAVKLACAAHGSAACGSWSRLALYALGTGNWGR